jgi:hypothetical protein
MEDKRSNRAWTETQISGPPLPLAIGKITRLVLRIELHTPDPAHSPAFVLLIWPSEPSELAPNPQAIAAVASCGCQDHGRSAIMINRARRW